jgi:hypothetical protein
MKTNIKTNLIIAVFLAVVAGLAGCRDDEEKKEEVVVPTDLPEWLQLKLAIYESEPMGLVKVYEGTWNNRTVYYIKNGLSSCLICDTYYRNGEKVVFNAGDGDLFYELSKNWKLVWKYVTLDVPDF